MKCAARSRLLRRGRSSLVRRGCSAARTGEDRRRVPGGGRATGCRPRSPRRSTTWLAASRGALRRGADARRGAAGTRRRTPHAHRRDEGRVARRRALPTSTSRARSRRSSRTSTPRSTLATTTSSASSAAAGDQDLFDDQGVTGMHAIERILYADTIPPSVVIDFEKALPGYEAAAFPGDRGRGGGVQDQALRAARHRHDDAADAVDSRRRSTSARAFQGLISLMNEQREKVNKAATGRGGVALLAAHAGRHPRATSTAPKTIYALFQPWILSKTATAAASDDRDHRRLRRARRGVRRRTPATRSRARPRRGARKPRRATDLATPFGKLYSAVTERGRSDARRLGGRRDERGGRACSASPASSEGAVR